MTYIINKSFIHLFFALTLCSLSIKSHAQMVLEYNLSKSNTQITLPLAGTVNVNVNWGDGSELQTFTNEGIKPHTFTSTGIKTVTITGTLTGYGISNYDAGVGNSNLTRVLGWDGLGLKSLNSAFYFADSLRQVPLTLPSTVTDLSGMFKNAKGFNQPIGQWNTAAITNMSNMFSFATAFNQPIGTWNTSAVTNMSKMFEFARAFNQPIGTWNTSAVTDMSGMFDDAITFNQPIGAWNTAAVTKMDFMFFGAGAFNQPLDSWNTSAVTDMGAMFYSAGVFNQPISSWNTAAVLNMSYMFLSANTFNQPIDRWNTAAVIHMTSMFYNAVSFDQPIGTWNTAAVTDMNNMFYNAVSFNQPLGSWNIAAVTEMIEMFYSTALCTDNYDNLLNGWATQAVKTGISFDGGSSKYSSASAAARASLISKGWTISDAGTGTTEEAKCITTSVMDMHKTAPAIVLYPNPVEDKLTIRIPTPTQGLLTYTIYSALGQLVLQKEAQLASSTIEIGLEGLQPGTYILKIKSDENLVISSFVKE